MVRYLFAVPLTVVGAIGATIGLIRPWQDGRSAADLALHDLFADGPPDTSPGFVASIALPLLAGVVVAVLGLLMRRKALVALGWLVCAFPPDCGRWAPLTTT